MVLCLKKKKPLIHDDVTFLAYDREQSCVSHTTRTSIYDRGKLFLFNNVVVLPFRCRRCVRRITVFISTRDLLCPLYRSGRVSLGFPCPTRTRAREPVPTAPIVSRRRPPVGYPPMPLVPDRQRPGRHHFSFPTVG